MSAIIPITFPSLHDGALLQGRFIIPNLSSARSIRYGVRNGVVLAHPYAPLGGTFDDPVLALLTRQLLAKGFVVGTLNFRGAGLSEGKTSWSAEAEERDFASFAGLFIYFVSHIAVPQAAADLGQEHSCGTLRIILGGYSYGSMIASRMASAADIYCEVCDPSRGSLAPGWLKVAEDAIASYEHSSPVSPKNVSGKALDIHTYYLLISPLLPPVSTFLAISIGKSGWNAKSRQSNLTKYPTFAVFGGRDIFTSRKKLRTWGEKMVQRSSNEFQFLEVEDAGHFWHEPGAADELRDGVMRWVSDFVLQ